MDIFQVSALAAALCWAFASMISSGPAAHFGPIAFNRIRQIMMFVLLGTYVLVAGTLNTIPGDQFAEVMLSGLVGIFLGDTALFAAMNRLGPRRTLILFSMNAPISTLLAFLLLGEVLSTAELAGTLVAIAGVFLAIAFGKTPGRVHVWEAVNGPLWVGIALGLVAATGQSLGALMIRPIMAAGADAIAVSAIRIGVAAFFLTVLAFVPIAGFKSRNPPAPRALAMAALSGFVAMGVGMTLVTYALSGGEVGIVSTLSATSPVLMLPLLWVTTKQRPAAGAWIGATMVVGGAAMIFMG